jgi:hypothetical protein
MTRMFVVALLLGIYLSGANDPAFDRAGSPIGVLAGSHARLGAPQPRSSRPLNAAARAALATALEPSERIELTAAAVGCVLVMTDRRLMVVRDGASYRPKSGIQSWPLDRGITLRLSPMRRGQSQLLVDLAGRSGSVFVTAEQLADAQALIAEVRRRAYSDD